MKKVHKKGQIEPIHAISLFVILKFKQIFLNKENISKF